MTDEPRRWKLVDERTGKGWLTMPSYPSVAGPSLEVGERVEVVEAGPVLRELEQLRRIRDRVLLGTTLDELRSVLEEGT